MIAIFKREFRAYFQNVIGWLFIAAVLAVYGIYYFAYNLAQGYAYISYPLSSVTIILLIAIPILTMRSLSDERRSKTDQLTLTSPISVGKLVFGKYLAMVAVYTIDVVIIIISALLLSRFGTVPFGESAVAIFGFWLFGCAYLSIGMFLSSLTESQVISAVLTFLVLFLTYMMSGICSLISSDGNLLTTILSAFDVYTQFSNFLNGMLEITSVIYFLSIVVLMNFLTCQSIQKRRWSVSRNTISTGVFSGGFIAVGIVLTVIVNLLVGQIPVTYTSFDCTYSKYYEITEDTETVLADLDTDITIYVYVAESSKDTMIDTTLQRYAALSKHITVEYVNPNSNPTFYTTYTDTTPTSNSVIVVSENRSRVIDYYDIIETSIDYSTYSYTYAYDAEGEITSAIEYVSMDSDELPVVYEVTGHNEVSIGSNFEEALEKANITLESLELLNEESVPEDAAALIINSPSSDFNEADAQKVIDYLQAGGKVLITADYLSQDLENFQSILEAYGVTSVPGVVVENDTNYYYYMYGQLYLLPEIASTDYSSSSTSSYVLAANCQGFTYTEDSDEDTEEDTEDAENSITYTEILTTSESAVSKTDYTNITTAEYEDGDTQGPFALGLAVEQLTEDESETSQLVLLGSEYFLDDSFDSAVSNGNSTLFTDIISAFVGDVELSTSVIASKSLTMDTLTVTASAIGLLGVGFTIVIPLVLLAAGIVIWVLRRRK